MVSHCFHFTTAIGIVQFPKRLQNLPSRIQGKGSSCSRAYSQSAWRFGHWSMAASRTRSRTSCFPLGPIPAKTNHPGNNIKLDIPTADTQPTTLQSATHKTAKPKKKTIGTTKKEEPESTLKKVHLHATDAAAVLHAQRLRSTFPCDQRCGPETGEGTHGRRLRSSDTRDRRCECSRGNGMRGSGDGGHVYAVTLTAKLPVFCNTGRERRGE